MQGGDVIVLAKGETVFFQYMQTMFDNLLELNTQNTMNITGNDVVNMLADLSSDYIDKDTFLQGMTINDQNEEDIITYWKWAATRGVSGTPTFAVNGVMTDADQTWTLSDWENLLNPLYQSPAKHHRRKHHHMRMNGGGVHE